MRLHLQKGHIQRPVILRNNFAKVADILEVLLKWIYYQDGGKNRLLFLQSFLLPVTSAHSTQTALSG